MVDYDDADGLTEALAQCHSVVHLVGIIRESAANPFVRAHEYACTALETAAAAAGVGKVVHLSILGADPASTNACLASRGRADAILLAGRVPACIIRVPMVLGEGDYASASLLRQARSRFAVVFRAASREQPIYAGDVLDALTNALARDVTGVLELAGPESLSRRELIQRTAAVLGESATVVSLPIALGILLAFLMERRSHPPITRAMLGVLDHDDAVETRDACERLGLTLTPLDDTIRHIADSSMPAR